MSLPNWDDPAFYLKSRRQRLARASRALELATKRGSYRGSVDGLTRLARSVSVLRGEIRELAIECRARAGHRPTVARCTWVARVREARRLVRQKMEWLGYLWSNYGAREIGRAHV